MPIGSPWQDVFLWGGVPRVGTPKSLFEQLRPEIDRLVARIPISTLELALAADAPNISTFVSAAVQHVERRHGEATAAQWRRDVLLKGEVRLALRKLLGRVGASGDALTGVRPTIVDFGGVYSATIPAQTSSFLAAAGLLDDARHAVWTAAQAVGFDLRLDIGALKTQEILVDKAAWLSGAARILVVPIGSRAGAIARHISAPDWIPIPHAPDVLRHWTIRRGHQIGDACEVIDCGCCRPP